MKHLKKLLFLIIIPASLLFTGCGKDGKQQDIVQEVNVLTSLEDGDVYLSLALLVKIGTTNLTSVTLPIVNPYDQSIKYGEISFKPTLTAGVNEIKLKFNMSFAAVVNGGYATLPNGADLPIGGLNESDIIELGIEQIHSKIYLGLQKDRSVFGFAVAIKEFDKLNGYIPGANVFLGFDIKGVLGSVGLFTGKNEWESGLGFFLDISKYLTNDIINDMIAGKKISQMQFQTMQSEMSRKSAPLLSFPNEGVTIKAMRSINKELKRLDKKTLHFVPAR